MSTADRSRPGNFILNLCLGSVELTIDLGQPFYMTVACRFFHRNCPFEGPWTHTGGVCTAVLTTLLPDGGDWSAWELQNWLWHFGKEENLLSLLWMKLFLKSCSPQPSLYSDYAISAPSIWSTYLQLWVSSINPRSLCFHEYMYQKQRLNKVKLLDCKECLFLSDICKTRRKKIHGNWLKSWVT